MKPQEQLDAIHDPQSFLAGMDNWSNHRIMLMLGLHLTKGAVMELGSGQGSTPLLREYCKEHKRKFESLDYNKDWAEKMGATYVPDWNGVVFKKCGLSFIDNSPGESRQGLLVRMEELADVIVCHDTEIGGAGAYGWDFSGFAHSLHYNRHGGGAGASIVSSKIDVSKYSGLTLGGFKFDAK